MPQFNLQDGYHVFAGDKIQDALELAARNTTNKIVKVHAGECRYSKRQALIWFNNSMMEFGSKRRARHFDRREL
jgi:hypothetical protein